MTRHLHAVADISRMLAERAGPLAQTLLPSGRRHGLEWRCGSLAGEKGNSLAVHIGHGSKAGVWKDFAGGEGGDALDLVAAARFGGDLTQALRWARTWLGLADGPMPEGRAPAPPPAAPVRDDEDRRQKARGLWHGGRELAGSPADAYLEGRGVGVRALGRPPGALRFRPDAWCAERRINAPAMVACIVRGPRIVACHRTYLAPGPAGRWTKAPISAAKKVLGPLKGGLIPLARGASQRPMREAPEDDVLAIVEGIEDGLTVALQMPEWRVAAAVTLGNMADLELDARFQDIVLVFDRDGDNPQAKAMRERSAERLLRQGRSVREVRPPEGFKDFNQWHLAMLAREGLATPRSYG